MDTPTTLHPPTPAQHSALFDQAKRDAVELRREAMRDAASWLAARTRELWHRIVPAAAAQRTPEAAPCAS